MKYYGERLKEESWKGTGLKKAADLSLIHIFSAVIALVPYLCMWKVIKLAVLNWPRGLAGGTLVWGWMAVASSLLSMLCLLYTSRCV